MAEDLESELACCRQEFSDFAYKVSHDLQAPLRSIVGFANFIVSSAQEKLSQQEQQDLDMVINSAKHAQALLDALLQYSRLNTVSRPLVPVDMGALVSEVVRLMKEEIEAANATVICGTLPEVIGDSEQLRLLFKHLLANAIKFHTENIPPRIEIGALVEPKSASWRFYVADNGIGIPEKYHHCIFDVLRKLHAESEYPGLGMGLAIAKKIIEHHHGAIGVESVPEAGTKIWFTLPSSAPLPQ
jgi:light-regulated signal transduction histidine kinase (bacteriophytochrome)